MRLQFWKQWKKITSFSLYLKCGAIFLFLTLTVFIVACGGNSDNNQPDLGNPVVTVTIRLGDSNGLPPSPLPDYSCGAWATDSSPTYATGSISVFAKFVHNQNGNPEGVGNASATATVNWPDGSTDTRTATTTSDGLAVFSIPLKPVALNKIVLIHVTFFKAGLHPCTVPQAAYFTIVISSPTASPGASPSATTTPTVTTTPEGTPSPSPTTTPTPYPTPTKTPTPTPTKPPH